MNQQEILAARLQSALHECAQHHKRLQSAWADAHHISALQGDSPEALTEAEIRTLDQLVFRFGRLQDAMGTRLLPALLQQVLDWQEQDTFLDALNRAEKRDMIPSANQWVALRRLRNQSTHEYPDKPEWIMASLRHFVANTPLLTTIYLHLLAWAQQHVPEL
ncbi:MAG: hypothetical protein H7838_09000 [Magnetococcus sp. DMHC-8]